MKIAIVTGASSGIGREYARQLDKENNFDEFWLIARRKERLEKLSRELNHSCKLFGLDLGLNESFRKLERCLEEFSADFGCQVVYLVNGAGLGFYGNVSDLSLEQIEATVNLNCTALTKMCRVAASYLGEKSMVLNVASGSAFLPQPGFSVYAASKSYVLSLSGALRRELKDRRVQVTAVCPGPVSTEFFDHALTDGQTMPEYKKKFMASPEKVVAKSLKDARKNKHVSAYSFSMKLVRIGAKVLPQEWLLKWLY